MHLKISMWSAAEVGLVDWICTRNSLPSLFNLSIKYNNVLCIASLKSTFYKMLHSGGQDNKINTHYSRQTDGGPNQGEVKT